MKFKINLETWNLAAIWTLVCTWKLQWTFFFISAVISCQQLITVDENENLHRKLKFGTSIDFSIYMNLPLKFFFHISCHQLSTARNSWLKLISVDENWNQPRELKFVTHINFSVQMIISVDFLYHLAMAENILSQWKST